MTLIVGLDVGSTTVKAVAARDSAIRLSSYECGMDQPTYSPVQQIVESSGTLFFSFQDLDATKPAGSVNIRVETIAHYLGRYASDIIARKKAAAPGGPLERAARPAAS
jgi:predicted nucleotide-binding protein (sugar kinase/HSP70/actin superfamily)